MAKLTYAQIIERDQRYKILADLGLRLDLADTPKLIPRLVDLVAPEHLELLAESRSILNEDGYWLAESDSARRKLIKGAYELHRYKGTAWAVREIVRRLGFGEIQLTEGLSGQSYNGKISYDGRYVYGDNSHWSHYVITLSAPITNNQAQLLRHTLAAFAPARCILASLDYQSVPLKYDSTAVYDGAFNFGVA